MLPRLEIGEDAVVGAGAVVTRSVPSGKTVIGSPARPMERSEITIRPRRVASVPERLEQLLLAERVHRLPEASVLPRSQLIVLDEATERFGLPGVASPSM